MSNLVALLAHTGRGGEVLLDGDCHIMRSEMGGIASLAGLFYRPIASTRGAPDLEDIGEHLTEKLTANKLATALVCVETTHNSAGGAVIPLDYMAKLRALTAEKGVPVHIDGARIFNAAVALGVPAAEIAQARRQHRLLRQQGPERAVRLGAVRLGGVHRDARAPIAAWSAAACGRPASWRRPASSGSRR